MRRVPYLAALAGPAGRRQAPLLRPPRRLFPYEPSPVGLLPLAEPLPPPSQPAEEAVVADPPRREPSVSSTTPLATERVAEEPASVAPPKVVSLVRSRSSDAAPAPMEPAPIASRAAPRVEPTQREATRVAEAAVPPKTSAAAPIVDTPRSGRDQAQPAEPQPANREREPARAVADRRPTATLEPARLRPRAVPEPERATTARLPKAPAERARAPQLHIGSIDVVVTPALMAPVEPALAAPPVPARRSPAPFDPRNASTTSWFGLAQR